MGMHNFFFEENLWGVRLSVFCEGMESTGQPLKTTSGKEMHQHFNYELFFICGEVSMIYEDAIVDYKESIVVLPPWKRHYCKGDKGIDYQAIYFSLNPIEGKCARCENIAALFDKEIVELSMNEDECYYVSQLCGVIQKNNSYAEVRYLILLLLYKMLVRVVPGNLQTDTKKIGEQNYAYYINLIDHYLNNYFYENICMENLASEMYLSARQVSRIIKKEYGCTFKQLLNRKRLFAASVLLKNTELTVVRIANDVGYENENYFSACFRREYGMTPSQYREKCKAEIGLETATSSCKIQVFPLC